MTVLNENFGEKETSCNSKFSKKNEIKKIWYDTDYFCFECVEGLETQNLKNTVRHLEEYREMSDYTRNSIMCDIKNNNQTYRSISYVVYWYKNKNLLILSTDTQINTRISKIILSYWKCKNSIEYFSKKWIYIQID